MATRLEQLYGTIDKLELVVGLFAEQPPEDALFGDLMRTMVAYDAFTQIYTNPLLSQAIHRPEHLTPYGLELIDATTSITELVQHNVPSGDMVQAALGVVRPDQQRR